MKASRTSAPLMIAIGVALTGCNLFAVIDKPSGDAQIQDAARGAVDRGDFAKARELYGKLASPDDQARAEEAFLKLTQAGAGLGPFMEAFGDGGTVGGLNLLARRLAAKGADGDQRTLIYEALQTVDEITDAESTQLKGLVRLMASAALAASCIAVDVNAGSSGDPNKIEAIDLMQTPDSCTTGGCAVLPAACQRPTNATFTFDGGTKDFSTTIASIDPTEDPKSSWLNGAINAIDTALNEIGAGGKFGDGLGGLSSALPLLESNEGCYRRSLVEAGVGE